MLLKKLLVSGFKSFVDTTDIRFPSHLVGVVGPNGCGKSNVIDAVRWVMGESSAKMLRGDNMTDVIFNGSAARKPVGKASVELIFDNSDGQAPGNYGQFAEISVKRNLTRDGQSTYLINNIKTRRRDVLDLFRGTGLGPRSYSIIEQGMVSRIVEARPEDLRVFVEEAAGTSKYKDRRRETANRIGHTRENLERVADIRDELDKQLRRLKRQSASARRYKVLKAEEREVNAQLHTLKLNELNLQHAEQDRLTAARENELQSALAEQRQIESELESLRKQQVDSNEKTSAVQQEFYRVGGMITNLEQRIEHQKETKHRESEEISRLEEGLRDRQRQIDTNMERGLEFKNILESMQPKLENLTAVYQTSQSELENAEKILQDWVSEMEAFNEQSREPSQQVEVQKSRIQYLEQHSRRVVEQKSGLQGQLGTLNLQLNSNDIDLLKQEVSVHDNEHEQADQKFRVTEAQIKDIRNVIEERRIQSAEHKKNLHETTSRLDSLKEIQAAALGGDEQDLEDWLQLNGLAHAGKLATEISVEPGWEKAVDCVLNGYLKAICVGTFNREMMSGRPDFSFSMICESRNSPTNSLPFPNLISHISRGKEKVEALLADIYTIDSVEEGLAARDQLSGQQKFVTQAGEIIGANWVKFSSQGQIETGVLFREEEISLLVSRKEDYQNSLEAVEEELSRLLAQRNELESKLQSQRQEINELRSRNSTLHSQFGRKEAQFLEAKEQVGKIANQIAELEAQILGDQSEVENANTLLAAAQEKSGNLNEQRERLSLRKDNLATEVSNKRSSFNLIKDDFHETSLQKQKIEGDIEVSRENIRRLSGESEQNEIRLEELRGKAQSPDQSTETLKAELESLIEEKLAIDERFSQSRDEAAGFDTKITRNNETRSKQVDKVNTARELLDQNRLTRQEIFVRRETLVESINQQGFDTENVVLPEDSSVVVWQGKLDDIERKVTRIGPVNLVAIEEFDEQSERMEYLDSQYADLTEALDTLESVIRKIDRETRTRFRETFEKINAGFNEFFPKLFGGGSAELQLDSDDLLTSGIRVMARPPGKHNSHIQLLSGGEKALTAVALLFSLFELNPTPFCMLDEVDAPLDDTNVGRYCETLKRLATKSQMIVITHNKVTMESMDLLVGVTMAEAGVSRLVSVDIDQAVKMATD